MARLLFLQGKSDLWVRNFYAVLTFPFDRTQGKHIAVRHHADFSGFPWWSQPFFMLQEKLFEHNAKRLDALVVVSAYWKNHFEKKGFSNVRVIYNGFDLARFSPSQEEVAAFQKKYGLEGKPVVYLGNCQKAKGVVESWKALQSLNVHLVTSGKRMVRIPAKNLDLPYREYLCLLACCNVVVAMSQFKEGWNRTAHEAMLLRRPVVGSGLGGMKELLEGGEQPVCQDFSKLKDMVEYLLSHKEEGEKLGNLGYEFAKTFSRERFEKEWFSLVRTL